VLENPKSLDVPPAGGRLFRPTQFVGSESKFSVRWTAPNTVADEAPKVAAASGRILRNDFDMLFFSTSIVFPPCHKLHH
jgi:hypothetical protein